MHRWIKSDAYTKSSFSFKKIGHFNSQIANKKSYDKWGTVGLKK